MRKSRSVSLRILLISGGFISLSLAICAAIALDVSHARVTLAVAIFVFLSMAVVRFDPIHPATWYPPFLFLYHYSVLILDLLNVWPVHFAKEISLIGFLPIAVSTSILILGTGKSRHPLHLKGYMPSDVVLWFFYIVLVIVSVHENGIFLMSDLTTKQERHVAGLTAFGFAFNWLVVVYTLLLAKSLYLKATFPKALVFLSFILTLFSALNLGERDILYVFILVTLLITYSYYRPRKIYVFSIGALVLLSIPVLQELKTVFVREVDISLSCPIWIAIMRGEFIHAGRNLDWLLERQANWDLFYGSMLLQDLAKGIVPGIISNAPNSQTWFNTTFFPNVVARGQGYGFSMAASWYINFGLTGVIFGYAVVVFLLLVSFHKSRQSLMGLVFYVSVIPFFIYSIRGDMSVLLSYLLKQVGLPIMLLVIADKFLKHAVTSSSYREAGRRPVRTHMVHKHASNFASC